METTTVQNTTISSIILTTSTVTTSVSGTSFISAAAVSITKPASSTSMANTIQPRTWEEMTEKEKQLVEVLGPYHCKASAGFEWIPNGWKLAPIHIATTDNSSPNTSFEELFLEKIQAVGGKKKDKQSKVDFRGKVRMIEVLKGRKNYYNLDNIRIYSTEI